MQCSSRTRIENHCCRNTCVMFDVHFVTQFRLPAIQWFMWKHLQQPLGGFGLRWHAQYCVVEAQRCYVSSVSRAHKLSVSRLCLKPPPSSQRATAAREQFESAIMRSRREYGKAGLCVYSWQQNRRYIYAFRHRVCCSSRYRLQARAEAMQLLHGVVTYEPDAFCQRCLAHRHL